MIAALYPANIPSNVDPDDGSGVSWLLDGSVEKQKRYYIFTHR